MAAAADDPKQSPSSRGTLLSPRRQQLSAKSQSNDSIPIFPKIVVEIDGKNEQPVIKKDIDPNAFVVTATLSRQKYDLVFTPMVHLIKPFLSHIQRTMFENVGGNTKAKDRVLRVEEFHSMVKCIFVQGSPKMLVHDSEFAIGMLKTGEYFLLICVCIKSGIDCNDCVGYRRIILSEKLEKLFVYIDSPGIIVSILDQCLK